MVLGGIPAAAAWPGVRPEALSLAQATPPLVVQEMAMKSHEVSKDSVSNRPATGMAGQGHISNDSRTNPAAPTLPYRSREKDR